MVQFVWREVIAEPVPPIIGEPEFLGLRVPVKSHGVANPSGKDFEIGTVGFHPRDGRIAFVFALAYVAWCPDWDVEHPIRPKADEFPAMTPVSGKAVVHDDRLWRIVQVAFNIIEAQNAV